MAALLPLVGRRALAAAPLVRMAQPARFLNLHEYQGKGLMQQNGVAVQKFKTASTWQEAEQFAKELQVKEIVMKAQVHAGGRGKGHFTSGLKSGVHLTRDPVEVGKLAKQMLGYNLITKQTTAEGVKVSKVMVAEALDIKRETYFAILMDRQFNGPVMVGSSQGGMDIEEVAEKNPESIVQEIVDINKGVTDEQAKKMAAALGYTGKQFELATEQIKALYKLFTKIDATQIEVNPFAETPDGQVVCFDAKIVFDENAAFRQKEIFAMRDPTEEDPREVAASQMNLNYIGMDGNIGCLVNGAGLAMATMDIIKINGGEPANFLDCGGGANEQMITHAFKLLSSDPQVKVICVNIFGGIVNCATIANGIIAACKHTALKLPLVVRLAGTNVDNARTLLETSGLPIIFANDMDDVAKKAVAALPKAK